MKFNLEKIDFKPSKRSFDGPKLWVKEFRFYADKNSNSLQRKIDLQPGVNILWADPSSDKRTAMGNDGGSGHSAGKTLFCRLIRYALGEQNYGSDEEREAILSKFISPFILVELVIKGEHWIVKRPLGQGGGHHAFNGSFAQFPEFELIENWQHYNVFTALLNELVCEGIDEPSIPSFNEKLTWDALRPWLTREQECRMTGHAAWRNRKEQRITYNEGVIRCTLGLVSREEEKLQQLRTDFENARKDNENKEIYFRNLIDYNEKTITNLQEKIQQQDIDLTRGSDDILIHQLNELIKQLKHEYEESINAKLKEEQKLCEKSKVSISEEIQQYNMQCQSLKVDIVNLERNIDSRTVDPNASAEELSTQASAYICNTPVLTAIKKGCPCITQYNEFQGITNAMALDAALNKFCENLKVELKEKQGTYTIIEKIIQSLRNKERDIDEKMGKKIQQLYQEKYTSESHLYLLQDFQKAIESLKRMRHEQGRNSANLKINKQKAKEYADEINGLVDDTKSKYSRLQQVHEEIMQSVISEDIEYEMKISASKCEFKIKNHNSTATNVAAVIAFDYATLIYGLIESKHAHPGFLMHDSPREADMSADIFNNLLRYLPLVIQSKYSDNMEPQFQYIVTTTTKPTEELNRYILSPVLRADRAEDRLLAVDF